MINLIVAYDENRVIGSKGDIPWRISEDFKHFKKTTLGHTIIMGRKTWDSLPKKPLPDRRNVVVTHDPDKFLRNWMANSHGWFVGPPNDSQPCAVNSLEKAIELLEDRETAYIIGGSQIYKEALEKDLVNHIVASEVQGKHEGDVYFPRLKGEWAAHEIERFDKFKIVEYRRLNYEDESRRVRG